MICRHEKLFSSEQSNSRSFLSGQITRRIQDLPLLLAMDGDSARDCPAALELMSAFTVEKREGTPMDREIRQRTKHFRPH
jgi:hypothetical protein